MRTSISESQAPPPYSSSSTSQPQQQTTRSQERTPLLSSTPRNQQAYTYTYIPPSSSHPENTNPPPSTYHAFLYRPLFRTAIPVHNRPRTLANKACRVLLFWLLGVAIVGALFKSYTLYLTFHPPGINLPVPPKDIAPLRIAVIGAGPAGVSAALRISEVMSVVGRDGIRKGEQQVEVVVLESQEKVGGRMGLGLDEKLDLWDGLKVEIEDIANAELFADAEGLVRKKAESVLALQFAADVQEARERVERVGFLNGRGFDNYLPRPISSMLWTQWISLFVRYGNNFVAAKKLPTGTMRAFNEMVKMPDKHVFDSMDEWLQKGNLRGSVEMSARERMRINGVGDGYRNKIIEAQVRRQLGQGTEELSDLALSLALAREDMSSSRSTNGIKMEDVLQQLLARSGAEIRLGTTLTSLKQESHALSKKPVWKLGFDNAIFGSEVFDKVILTIPWGKNEEGYYRHVVNTIVISTKGLNLKHIKVNNENDIPSQILPVEEQNMHEISHIKDVFGPDAGLGMKSMFRMYRVLSDDPLSEQELDLIWEGGVVKTLVTENKYAYPLLFPRDGGFGGFMLDEGLWSTASVEKVASSVDLSWAAGENVANLIKLDLEN